MRMPVSPQPHSQKVLSNVLSFASQIGEHLYFKTVIIHSVNISKIGQLFRYIRDIFCFILFVCLFFPFLNRLFISFGQCAFLFSEFS